MGYADSVTEELLRQARQPAYWESINPGMSISRHPLAAITTATRCTREEIDSYLKRIIREGYFLSRPLIPEDEVRRLRECLVNVTKAGFPPVFVYLYDAFWQLFHSLRPLYDVILGPDHKISQNIWAWHVDKSIESAGWKPHRDLTGYQTLEPDGRPRFATVWIPLTEVTPLNACMYILPTHLDPWVQRNELHKLSIPEEYLQSIRALPAPPGSVLSWNANVLHWGARSSEHAAQPRISVACSLVSANAADPTGRLMAGSRLDRSLDMPFEKRLALISLVVSYFHDAPIDAVQFSPELRNFCKEYMPLLESTPKQPDPARSAQAQPSRNVGRNDPCPCGSGQKYKKCHGR